MEANLQFTILINYQHAKSDIHTYLTYNHIIKHTWGINEIIFSELLFKANSYLIAQLFSGNYEITGL